VSKVRSIPISIMRTLFPEFSQLHSNNRVDLIANYLERSMKFTLVMTGSIGVVLAIFAQSILTLWIGEAFALKAYVVMQIVAIGIIVNSLAFIPFNLLQAIGRPDIPAKMHVLELPLYIAASLMVVKTWGIEGMAIVWLSRVTLDALLNLFFAQLELRKHGQSFKLRPALHAGTMLALLSLALWGSKWILARAVVPGLASILIILTLFTVVVWRVVLDSREKEMLSTLLTRGHSKG